MALSKESIRKLRAVKAAILAEPELYDQCNFPSSYCGHTCLTPCCIEGWAAWVNNPNPEAYNSGVQRGGFSLATELGITTEEGGLLFSGWDDAFSDAWDFPGTRRGARAGAKRIDHFIATDGAE